MSSIAIIIVLIGGGGVQGQGKGQRLIGIKQLMTTLGWQRAKVKPHFAAPQPYVWDFLRGVKNHQTSIC